MKVDMWCKILNSRYRALWMKVEDERIKVPKDISIVDQGEGQRTIVLVLVGKS
jgi:hypothetical protein